MTDDKITKNKMLSRRGLLTAGGVFALAGLGAGVGAVWNVSDGFSNSIVRSGNLQVSRGKTTPYVGFTADPMTNEQLSGQHFYRIDTDSEDSHVSGTVASAFDTQLAAWVTDYTFVNNGDNMQAAIVPKIEVDLDAVLKYMPPEQRDDPAAYYTISALTQQIQHVDSLNVQYDTINGQKIYYTAANVPNNNTFLTALPDSLPYDYEEKFAEEGRDIEEEDPTGEFRKFTYNYDPAEPDTPISINIPKGETVMSVLLYKTLYFTDTGYSDFVKDGIFSVENAINYSFDLKQIRG